MIRGSIYPQGLGFRNALMPVPNIRMMENMIGIPPMTVEDFDVLHPGVRTTVKRDKYGNVIREVKLH